MPSVGSTALGFFVSSQSPGDVLALAKQLGVQVQGLSGYTDGSSWSSIGSYQPPQTSLRLYLGVNMSPADGTPAQTPSHLSVYQQLAENLVNGGQAYAIVRIGWEWNTTWFSWGVQNSTPTQYVTAFDDIVTTMRSVPGQHFLFDWCAAADESPTNGSYDASYPGDQYVDYVGTDDY
ncbi:MAG TPA: glycosyl hydrolase, partial [Acidimicrobiales bacterium]|nr:glycosyl hydrolase [Acidimicrobiales bacterium]